MAAHFPQLAACESPLEVDFVLLCEQFGLPIPEPNVRIGRWRPDMLWREARLIVELDGEDAHHTPAQLLADERRAADLRSRGFTVIRFTWEQVHFDADAVAADLRARLAG
jgi:very-short-patch-repair endonuclease